MFVKIRGISSPDMAMEVASEVLLQAVTQEREREGGEERERN